jgi:hypothetical protein
VSELVLSDVYWRWIFEELVDIDERESSHPLVRAIRDGFDDPSALVESMPVTGEFLELVRRVRPTKAPSFDRLVAAEGCSVPTAELVLAEFERLVREAVSRGSLQMEIE